MKYGFGIDLGGTTVKIAYFEESGTMLEKWEIPTVTTDGVAEALPIWTVTGPATNPSLTNITNGQILNFGGIVPSGQTLTVVMANQTATMAGANVFALISGDWIQLAVGTNKITYTATGATEPSTLSWNDIVG